jgi:hypothetical protein
MVPSVVLLNGGTSFGSPPVSLTVTCTYGGNNEAAALVSWSGARNLGTVLVSGGDNRTNWFTSAKSGSFQVTAEAPTPTLNLTVALYSRPDKSGATTVLAEASTPGPGCSV